MVLLEVLNTKWVQTIKCLLDSLPFWVPNKAIFGVTITLPLHKLPNIVTLAVPEYQEMAN